MTAFLAYSKSHRCYVVIYDGRRKDFYGGIDLVIAEASSWIRGGCK